MEELQLVQTRWHIEDRTNPSKGQVYREAVDLYTGGSFLKFRIAGHFVNLKVINKYNEMEMPFLCQGEEILVNLDDNFNQWPSKDGSESKTKHIKLEVEYTDVNPKFEIQKLWNIFPRLGYDNTYNINGSTQPEFYLTVPLGMKLRDNGKNTQLLLKIKNEKRSKRLHFYEDVHVDYINGRNTYRFLIKEKSYELIKSLPDDAIEYIKIHYSVANELKFSFFPIFTGALVLIGLLEFIYGTNIPYPNLTHLTYTIIFISFFTFYITLLKEGYEIPWNRFVAYITPIAALLLITPIVFEILIDILKLLINMI